MEKNELSNSSESFEQSSFTEQETGDQNAANKAASVAAATSQLYNTSQRLASLFMNPHMSDVTFRIKAESDTTFEFPAHKLILAMTSPVFHAMFYGRLKSDEDVITIEDVEPPAFKNLLRYIYTDNVNLAPDNVMATLYAAKKYNIEYVERVCVEYLKCILRPGNAFLLLGQAQIFDERQLENDCLETIDRYALDAMASEYFLNIDAATLNQVVKRNTMAVRECELFEAVVRWAMHRCAKLGIEPSAENQKRVLGMDTIRSIRYPLMSLEEFSPLVPKSGLLDDNELVKLFMYFTVRSPVMSPGPFLSVPRSSFLGKELVVNRFQRVETRWGYSGTSDRVRFFVDRKVFVVALGLYGSIHGPHEYDVYIEMLDYDSSRVVAVNSLRLRCDGTRIPFRVAFKSPVEILPNVNYVACATLFGPDSFYGTRGLRKVMVELPKPSEEPVTFHFTYAGGNNNGTSVEDGQIPQIFFHVPLD